MIIIIAGIGRIGYTLAKSLCDKGHDIVLIDNDKEICNKVSAEIDALIIHGDCTKTKTLEEAGIEDADIYIAVTGKEEVNLMSSLLAKSYGVDKTIARISEIEYKDVFERLGVDVVVSPELIAANYIEKLIDRPGILDLTIIGRGEAEILEFIIPEKSKVAYKKIKDLGRPQDYLIIAIYEGSELKIPSGDIELKPGDRVLVLVKKDAVDIIRKMFLE
ncbi:Trk system potassium uptake protein TrkA homolog [Methanocaldococcus lauensis]|nr:Trk system potassium uptake protein TrkA homolog [Methanocaldococcus lauensis]